MFDYTDVVKICKRMNNTKRNYLVLNERQCKHVPNSPSQALDMFKALAEKFEVYEDESVLVVGFAETATAIGAAVANYLGYDYINTTRENFDAKFIEFEESHSHATEQKLVHFDFNRYDRVLFVEDEVTTGNTILGIVNKLLQIKPSLCFSVASILNGMSDENLSTYYDMSIDVYYLVKLDNTGYSNLVAGVDTDGSIVAVNGKPDVTQHFRLCNTRKVTSRTVYHKQLEKICNELTLADKDKSVLVLGTEECMYPAIYIGSHLEKLGYTVLSHSTTRSPIEVSSDIDYALQDRLELPSVYDSGRQTYLYNIDIYGVVYIVTDCSLPSAGLEDLIKVLRLIGNNDIRLISLQEDTNR